MKPKKKKDKEYIAILNQPIEMLKKTMGQPVEFNEIISDVLRYNPKKEKK